MNKENTIDRRNHWDGVYSSKPSQELGWYQENPEISVSLIDSLELSHDSRIIDIGGGDSNLTLLLLRKGFSDVNLLDISRKAIERNRSRLGERSDELNYIHTDVLDFKPLARYDLWHDRACFHFLTSKEDQLRYASLVRESLKPRGYLIVGTFSDEGPEKCSGLPVHRYDLAGLERVFEGLELKEHHFLDHQTPSGNLQRYIFCLFQAKP